MIKLFSSRLLDRAARGLAPTDHSARSVCPKLANERPHEWLVFIIKELSEPPEALGKGCVSYTPLSWCQHIWPCFFHGSRAGQENARETTGYVAYPSLAASAAGGGASPSTSMCQCLRPRRTKW